MAEDTGTLAQDATSTDSLSPTLSTDSSGQGSDSVQTGGSDDTAALRAELEEHKTRLAELEQRHAGQTRVRQEIQAERDKFKAQMDAWRKAGVDPDEIDRAIAAASGAGAGAASSTGKLPDNIMTTEQYQQARTLEKWESLKEAFFDKNPDHSSEETSDWFDSRARRLAANEMAEFGRIVSTPQQIFKKVEAGFNKLQTRIAENVKKSLTEKREQVKSQVVTDSGHSKSRVDRGGDDDQPETPQQYAARRREQEARLRGR